MARKPAPAKAHAEAESSKPPTANEDPALALLHALIALAGACGSFGLFRQLAERRAEARAARLAMLNTASQGASLEALDQAIHAGAAVPPSEPAEFVKALRQGLERGRAACERARTALRAGAAGWLDAVGAGRGVALHADIQQAEGLFARLSVALSDPRGVLDQGAAALADAARRFARAQNEVVALLETRGLADPAPTPTVSLSPDVLARLEAGIAQVAQLATAHAERMDRVDRAALAAEGAADDATPNDPTMRDLAIKAGISDDTFRRVRAAAGIEVKLKGAAARNRRYPPSEVDRLIVAALAGNFLERTAMADKWAGWGSKKAASKPHASK